MIEIGDTVTVKKPEDTEQWPLWTDAMDKYDGAKLTVAGFSLSREGFYVVDSNYTFNSKWIDDDDSVPYEDCII